MTPTTAASNGIAAKPTAKIVKTAFKTLESAKSVRVYGSFRDSGARFKLDVTMGPTGMRGTMTAPFKGASLATVDMVVTHRKFYARSRTLWRQVGGAGLASLIGNRWVIIPVRQLSGFPFANAKSFIKLLNRQSLKSPKSASAHVKRAKTTVDGQPAIELSHGRTAIYIATTGRPYPLEIRQGSHGALHFRYSGSPVDIAAPPHAVDLSSLHG
ncbi:MAG TPA: hypothetical protein VGI64_07210 [Streptosporangiaceae bacterium]